MRQLVIVLLGLLALLLVSSLVYRRRRWALVVWMPPAVGVIFLLIATGYSLISFPAPPGPGGGGEGVAVIFLLVMLIISLVLLAIILVGIPRRTAWNAKGLVGGVTTCALVYGGAWAAADYALERRIVLRAVTADGQPAPGIVVWCEGLQTADELPFHHRGAPKDVWTTDGDGRCEILLRGLGSATLVLTSKTAKWPFTQTKVYVAVESGNMFYTSVDGGSPMRQPDHHRVEITVNLPSSSAPSGHPWR